jgi:hypothetical protein
MPALRHRFPAFALFAALTLSARFALAEDPPPADKPAAPPADRSDLERQLQKALQADQSTEAKAAAQSQPSTPEAKPAAGGIQSFNPDLSFIADFALAGFLNAKPGEIATFQPGGHDPQSNGFNLQAVELALGAAVDPYFRFDANLAFAPDQRGAFGFELEEAYATTLTLPANLQLRAGQFLNRFGRLNPQHPHTWDFADQPYVMGKFLGPDGNRGPGLEVSELLGFLPWYAELVVSGLAPTGDDNRSFLGGNADGAAVTRTPLVATAADVLYMAALKQFFPLSDNWSFAWGLSSLFGPNLYGAHARAEVYGTDIYLKFRPIDQASHTIVSLTAEALYRHRHEMQGPVATADDYGGYAQLFWRFDQRWGLAGRYDMASGVANDPDPDDAAWDKPRHRGSLALTFWPSEFTRLRLQANYVAALDRSQSVESLFLAFEFAAGAHGAHAF